jgi:hypothetical protein
MGTSPAAGSIGSDRWQPAAQRVSQSAGQPVAVPPYLRVCLKNSRPPRKQTRVFETP